MIEVEIKLPLYKRSLTQRLLEAEGFHAGKLVRESDWYYTSDFHDFMKTDEALRIRSVESLTDLTEKSILTYKGPKLDDISMTRTEIETPVGDLKASRAILAALSYRELAPVVKLRQYYHKDRITACIDQVEGLGSFLELEIIVKKEEEKETALDEIKTVLAALDSDIRETTTVSYLSMILRKQGKA